jgi:hypothetical protein
MSPVAMKMLVGMKRNDANCVLELASSVIGTDF